MADLPREGVLAWVLRRESRLRACPLHTTAVCCFHVRPRAGLFLPQDLREGRNGPSSQAEPPLRSRKGQSGPSCMKVWKRPSDLAVLTPV